LLGIYFGPAKWAKAIAVPRLPIPISHTSLPNDLARRQHYLQRLWGNATKMRNLQLHGLQWAYLFIKGGSGWLEKRGNNPLSGVWHPPHKIKINLLIMLS